jgi:feruloyl esterase
VKISKCLTGFASPLLFAIFAHGPGAATAYALEASDCDNLTSLNLTSLDDAPAQITGSAVVSASDGLPAYCRVEGYVSPQVGFEIRLPVSTWNGKYLQQGCGGMCGWINMGACEDALARNYAVANTDMGHKAPPFSALWARNNRSAEIDFAYRATHVLNIVARHIIEIYYGNAPSRAYFRGCSTGGRQGLISAQRFPDDFDGIIVGAPVIRQPGVGPLHLAWLARANMDENGDPILTADRAAIIGPAVMDACDELDGVADEIINDPRLCTWSPASLSCRGASTDACLTPAEIAVVERIYSPARNSSGRILFPGGMMRGSEIEWNPAIVAPEGETPRVAAPNGLISHVLRYLSFAEDRPADFGLLDLDFDRHPAEFGFMMTLNSAVNPDLRSFRARGGKLLMYHGWNDLEIPPYLSIDYYESAVAANGGRASAEEFIRLFMLPGVAHCRRGPGADAIDYLSYLEKWVEQDEAPDSLLAHHLVQEQSYLGLPRPRYPLANEKYNWTRPIYPYPDVAEYSGHGSAEDPGNWRRQRAELVR